MAQWLCSLAYPKGPWIETRSRRWWRAPEGRLDGGTTVSCSPGCVPQWPHVEMQSMARVHGQKPYTLRLQLSLLPRGAPPGLSQGPVRTQSFMPILVLRPHFIQEEGGVWCSGYDDGLITSWSVDRNRAPTVGGELSCRRRPEAPGVRGLLVFLRTPASCVWVVVHGVV